MTTATMSVACATSGTISLSARPTSSDDRLSGVTSIRSWEPVWISMSRLAPVVEAANSADITRIPGTKVCRVSAALLAGDRR